MPSPFYCFPIVSRVMGTSEHSYRSFRQRKGGKLGVKETVALVCSGCKQDTSDRNQGVFKRQPDLIAVFGA